MTRDNNDQTSVEEVSNISTFTNYTSMHGTFNSALVFCNQEDDNVDSEMLFLARGPPPRPV